MFVILYLYLVLKGLKTTNSVAETSMRHLYAGKNVTASVSCFSAMPISKNRTYMKNTLWPAKRVKRLLAVFRQSGMALCLIYLGGDLELNPGPTGVSCVPCGKEIRRNQKSVQCYECSGWFHTKCIAMNKKEHADAVKPDARLICMACVFPFINHMEYEDTSSLTGLLEISKHIHTELNEQDYDNQDDSLNSQWNNDILDGRKNNPSGAFIAHLSINSLQNKFEEFKVLNNTLKKHVFVLSETKIDASYPSSQFKLQGYHMYRKDRKKGGGGLLAYFSSA